MNVFPLDLAELCQRGEDSLLKTLVTLSEFKLSCHKDQVCPTKKEEQRPAGGMSEGMHG